MTSFQTFSDQELIALLNEGRQQAFDEIYNRYWKKLYNEAFKRLKNSIQSEEIVQDVFICIWNKREQLQIKDLFPYLVTSVRYQVYMLYKQERKLPFFEEPLESMASTAHQADSLFFAKELKSFIDTWMGMQPEKRREIFRLRYVEDFTPKEISDMLNISEKTVRNTLYTALSGLRGSLEKFMLIVPVSLIVLQNKDF
jgi:RNA polymerase sigma factor (sigma-70 family)